MLWHYKIFKCDIFDIFNENFDIFYIESYAPPDPPAT